MYISSEFLVVVAFCVTIVFAIFIKANMQQKEEFQEKIKDSNLQFQKIRKEYERVCYQKDDVKKQNEALNNENEKLKKEINYYKLKNEKLEKELEKFERLKKQDDDFHKVYDLIQQGKNVFITGGAGTGKSYILQHLKEFIPELKGNITSTTGVSSINIEGVTINSWAKFLFKFDYSKLRNKNDIENEILERAEKSARFTRKRQKDKIKKTKILAIDEISMLSDVTFRFLDLYLQYVRGTEQPFGGIQMVIIGDFCQLPPVTKNKNINDKSLHYAFLSESWKKLNLEYVVLKTFHRQEKDIKFAQCLNDIRLGCNFDKAEKMLSDCIVKESQINDEIVRVYQTNNAVRTHNEKCLNKLKTAIKIIPAENYFVEPHEDDNGQINYKIDNTKNVTEKDYSTLNEKGKIQDNIEKNTKSVQELKLKVNCKVMIIKNIDVDKGIANGTIGTATDIQNDIIYVDFGEIKSYPVCKEGFVYYNEYKKTYIMRKQFPLVLAYAITTHKSQGLTLEQAVVDISDCWEAGQAYVALSRVKTKDKLYILNKFSNDSIIADKDVIEFYKTLDK